MVSHHLYIYATCKRHVVKGLAARGRHVHVKIIRVSDFQVIYNLLSNSLHVYLSFGNVCNDGVKILAGKNSTKYDNHSPNETANLNHFR